MKKSLFYLFVCLIALYGCKKEDLNDLISSEQVIIDPTIEVSEGHLKFRTTESFRNLVEQMHEKEKYTLDNEVYEKFESKGFVALNRLSLTQKSKSFINNEFVEDTLIPDPYFSSLLNENREIEVNGIVYKINELGTFFSKAERLDEINEIINRLRFEKEKLKSTLLIKENLYELEDGIYMFDSQRVMQYEEIYDIDNEYTGGSGGLGGSNNSGTSNMPYDDIEYHPFDAHTIVGGWIQDVFGRTRAYNRNFSSTRRLRVNFYSVNYVVYSGIGLNVKYQKKNWIGWSKTDCEELRWGWEGLIYSYKLNYNMPSTGPAPVRKEYGYVPGISNKKAFTINIMDHEINIDYNKVLKEIIKNTWKWLENNLAAEAVEMRKQELSQFREIFPDKVKVVVNRYEEVKKNCDSFSKVFDWGTCEVSINFLNGSSFTDIVGLENNAMSFDVEKISVYGIAKNGNRYKGIAIVKD